MKKVMILAILLAPVLAIAQDSISQKGEFYVGWGYNRSAYLPSTIHFEGSNYDFYMYDLKATDFPSEFDPKVYFNLVSLSIPQYNYRLGYFVSDDVAISIGIDHMKYMAVQGEPVVFDGYINDPDSPVTGRLDDLPLVVDDSLIHIEHSDGLNYCSFEVDKHKMLWMSKNKKHRCNLHFGASLAAIVPRSDIQLWGNEGANIFHLSGWGSGLQIGIHARFFRHFAFNATGKAGYISMPDIVTNLAHDRASQRIFFIQGLWQVGYAFNLRN